MDLPVDAIIPKLDVVLERRHRAVLQAPPGAGKTTRVPLALLNRPWLDGGRILMLEPRRLAARMAAARMAATLGQRVGESVGYRMRMESRVGPGTRIEVLTEGVLTRMLQYDPSLEGVGLVIFDECHERSLAADLALALCLDIRGVLNPSLRLLAMSATLEARSFSRVMGHAPLLSCAGRQYGVDTVYLGDGGGIDLAARVAKAVRHAVEKYPGGVLAFLPGAPEIRKVERLLAAAHLPPDCRLMPLYGLLTHAEQQRAVEPPPPGCRKVVLATDIAETSLTIAGIDVVVDGGYRRVPRFDLSSGMTRLQTLPVSRASADQRRGRAGRSGPGVCLRLWERERNRLLAPHNRPEILDADLAPLALELALWGVNDPRQLRWLDPPPEAALQKARRLLRDLGAIAFDPSGAPRVTSHGREIAELGVHPRLSHMLLMAREEGTGRDACRLAALLGERDVLRFVSGGYDADLSLRLDLLALQDAGHLPGDRSLKVDFSACRRVLKTAALLEKRLGVAPSAGRSGDPGRLLAWAYPDRIACRRPGSRRRYLMTNGHEARFNDIEPLTVHRFLVAAALDGDRRRARIFLAAGYGEGDLREQYGDRVERRREVSWDAAAKAVAAVSLETLDALVLKREPCTDLPVEEVAAVLMEGIRREGIACLPWNRGLSSWRERVVFMRRLEGPEAGWPDLSETALLATLETWLDPYLAGVTRLKQLESIDLKSALHGHLNWDRRNLLDRLAPTHLTVPSGARIPIDYGVDPPVVAVRIQQMFGAHQTPTVGGGRQPLLLHLLSPAGRPVQITGDLAGFWGGSYHEVKKELKARYPKHPWPDDPLNAAATDRARAQGAGGRASITR